MTPERFETLAEAYGGDVARWPDVEREAAAAVMAERPEWAGGVLARARDLDEALAAFAMPRASADLTARIVAGAPRPMGRRWIGWLLPASMGAGLAAACAAGVVVGVQASVAASQQPAASEPDALVATVSDDDFNLFLDEDA